MDNNKLESITKDLTKLANHLDTIGKTKEADFVDQILTKLAFPGEGIIPGEWGWQENNPDLSLESIREAINNAKEKLRNFPGFQAVEEEAKQILVCISGPTDYIDEKPRNLLEDAITCVRGSELAPLAKIAIEAALEALRQGGMNNPEPDLGPLPLGDI